MRTKYTRLQEKDLSFVKDIYDYYTLHTTTVYFLERVSIDDLKTFIPVNDPVYHSYLVNTENGEPCGFCYFSRFKPREAYRISVEITIYLHPDFTGRGYGQEIMSFLEDIIRRQGFTNIVALIDSENQSSIRLFSNNGYERCAYLKEVAEKFGKKLDVTFYQKLLE